MLKEKLVDTMSVGVTQGSIIGLLFTNILLNDLPSFIFEIQPKAFQRTSACTGYKVSNHCISYVDDLLIIFNTSNISEIMNKTREFLDKLGLTINMNKTFVKEFKDSDNFSMNYLGFRYTFIKPHMLHKGTLISKDEDIYIERKSSSPEIFKVLISVSDKAMRNHKDKLKRIIRNSYNTSAPQLIQNLNPIIMGFSNYFNLGQSYRYLT